MLRVPKGSGAEQRLRSGWDASAVGPANQDDVDMALDLDRENAAARLGVLVLQLGTPCRVVEPAELVGAAAQVARRMLAGLPEAGQPS